MRDVNLLVIFTEEAFGAKLLEALTAGLYDGNKNCLREYVQNSIDSKAKRIDIYYENNRSDLVIKDTGCGMDKQELVKALHLGKSEKPDTAIGWRGIGIWSGIPACRRIVIITKKQNHPKYRIEIDADKLRDQYGHNLLATEVLTEITGEIEELELGRDESKKDSQYTIIRLEEMLSNQRAIFIEKDIKEYLERVVPAPFDTSKFTIGNEINKRLIAHGIKLVKIDIFFENQKIFRPPYNDDFFFSNIIEKTFFVNNVIVAYGWLLSSNKNRILKLSNRGVYFKKKMMTIGDANLVTKQQEGNYNQWQYGEIHIIHDGLKENAPRNNFEANNDIIDPFYKQVGFFVRHLQQMNQYQSHYMVSTPIEQIKKHIDADEIKTAQDKLSKLQKKLQKTRSFPTEPALQGMKKTIDKESNKNRIEIKKLEKAIKKKKKRQPSDLVKEKMERFSDFIKNSRPILKRHLSKTTQKGKLELNIDAMAPVKDLLQQKTGLTENDLSTLTRRAYDWKDVTKGDNGPILQLSESYRDRHFGAMIYGLYNLFVNPFKHEKGKPIFAYYESMTEEEKIETLIEFHHAQNLILRLIEKSDRIRNP